MSLVSMPSNLCKTIVGLLRVIICYSFEVRVNFYQQKSLTCEALESILRKEKIVLRQANGQANRKRTFSLETALLHLETWEELIVFLIFVISHHQTLVVLLV